MAAGEGRGLCTYSAQPVLWSEVALRWGRETYVCVDESNGMYGLLSLPCQSKAYLLQCVLARQTDWRHAPASVPDPTHRAGLVRICTCRVCPTGGLSASLLAMLNMQL